ncbi:MAG: NAD-dependent epimerase/dehydratase family protein [Solirubrobacteraceae bacterium]|nr:NAD-dependent epimerase/dehydratase family protein [Solirubrobacteraceae bacterium]
MFVTGGTGYIGSALVAQLIAAGHEVSALVRSDASAAAVEAAGATSVRGELTDAATVTAAAAAADAAIHTAATNDADGPAADLAVAKAILAGLGGKPYVHTSGVWVYGDTDGVATEDSPLAPPAITAWRPGNEHEVVETPGAHAVFVIPGLVWGGGQGQGLVPLFSKTDDDTPRFLDDGSGHWSLVHVDDIAALYVLALEAPHGSRFIGVADVLTQRDVAEAVAKATGSTAEPRSWPLAEAQAAFGALADAMALDQVATGARARRELGWQPEHADARAGLTAGA